MLFFFLYHADKENVINLEHFLTLTRSFSLFFSSFSSFFFCFFFVRQIYFHVYCARLLNKDINTMEQWNSLKFFSIRFFVGMAISWHCSASTLLFGRHYGKTWFLSEFWSCRHEHWALCLRSRFRLAQSCLNLIMFFFLCMCKYMNVLNFWRFH